MATAMIGNTGLASPSPSQSGSATSQARAKAITTKVTMERMSVPPSRPAPPVLVTVTSAARVTTGSPWLSKAPEVATICAQGCRERVV